MHFLSKQFVYLVIFRIMDLKLFAFFIIIFERHELLTFLNCWQLCGVKFCQEFHFFLIKFPDFCLNVSFLQIQQIELVAFLTFSTGEVF